jgi:DNA-binding NarL/FixJ family response regulator
MSNFNFTIKYSPENAGNMIRLGVVDDRWQQRNLLCERLTYSGEVEVVLAAGEGESFLKRMEQLERLQQPEVVLMDIEMPGMSGVDAVAIAKAKYPWVEFLMFTVFDDDSKVFEAVKAGASGYLLKDENAEAILNAIKQVKLFGAVPMSPSIARKALQMLSGATLHKSADAQSGLQEPELLSEREMEVLKYMVDGLDYRQIAELLFVSPHTVRKHITNIYNKLHVKSKVDAVKVAIRKRWF